MRYVDTEDLAIKADEIAPGRFRWRKYPTHIDLRAIHDSISDAVKPKKGYLLGSKSRGWLLTPKGLELARRRLAALEGADTSRVPLSPQDRQWRRTERARLLSEDAFLKFGLGREALITIKEVEAMFRVDDYITGKARERKIARLLNVFGDDSELGQVLKQLANKLTQE